MYMRFDMAQNHTQETMTGISYTAVDTGRYVIDLRESVHWTQADLARATGIDKSDLSKIEHNQRKLSGVWLILFQEAVDREKERLRRDDHFTQNEAQRIYDRYTAPMLQEMHHLGMSDSKVAGVQETMRGLIKSVFAS